MKRRDFIGRGLRTAFCALGALTFSRAQGAPHPGPAPKPRPDPDTITVVAEADGGFLVPPDLADDLPRDLVFIEPPRFFEQVAQIRDADGQPIFDIGPKPKRFMGARVIPWTDADG